MYACVYVCLVYKSLVTIGELIRQTESRTRSRIQLEIGLKLFPICRGWCRKRDIALMEQCAAIKAITIGAAATTTGTTITITINKRWVNWATWRLGNLASKTDIKYANYLDIFHFAYALTDTHTLSHSHTHIGRRTCRVGSGEGVGLIRFAMCSTNKLGQL